MFDCICDSNQAYNSILPELLDVSQEVPQVQLEQYVCFDT